MTSPHDAAGAYVLGVLDAADAAAFEAHLASCDVCAAHVEEFAGMEPMLAMLAEAPTPAPDPRPTGSASGLYAVDPHPVDPYSDDAFDAFAPRPPVPPARAAARAPEPAVAAGTGPGPQLLDRLIDEVGARRARSRRRTFALVAAAAVLVVGGPAVAVVATSGGERENRAVEPHPTSPAEDSFFHHMEEKIEATDPVTKVSATVGLEKKGWGTHTVLELKNVKGPLKCRLVAVSKSGEEEVVTSWAVPKWGYGIPGATQESAKNPLYIHGGAAMDRGDIDHFEVRTFDGTPLVEVDA
ncbi:zf-HC2 domain-containing protein [Streptomyces sp. ISL-36]|uniref:anti-sigma factor family protein n=1 Tax=Streptomyces sp. ISL-36 TaxID=2819182 RepID=UPI001BE53C0E|nr:zf-HC2 domain-containing protein [Streptomyces sp. ISL-36]MBT2442175.1 zf-HC2 domain-containing protein [Streptomyces sp. ISL-36]